MRKGIDPRCPEMETSRWTCPGPWCCTEVTLRSRGMILISCPVCGREMERVEIDVREGDVAHDNRS
jgi:hypothetical protein